jgi:hypothetical protein
VDQVDLLVGGVERKPIVHHASPARRKPPITRSSSGLSSRKASCPNGDFSSTKLARAPAALSAWTIVRDSDGRIEPVGVEAHQAEARRRAAEGVGEHAAMLLGQVEIVERPGDVEIGIGVEPVDEAQPLVAQIALDLEIGVEAEGLALAALQLAAELGGEAGLGEIGDVRRHPRHRQPGGGRIVAS